MFSKRLAQRAQWRARQDSIARQVDARTCMWCGLVHIVRKPEWENQTQRAPMREVLQG